MVGLRMLLVILTVVGLVSGQFPEYEAGVEEEGKEGPETRQWETEEKLGQVAGVATDSQGNIHIFHRGSRVWDADSFDGNNRYQQKDEGAIKEDTHLVVDGKSGQVVHRGGADMFYMPHGLFIDSEDNIWLTDVAMHQVFKLKAGTMEVELVLGTAFQPGNSTGHFCKPTDVAVSSDGKVFVADGYCNARVVKFDSDGTFMGQFGKPSKENSAGQGTFRIPHSLTLVEDWNILCVADRENERVQCFSAGLVRNERRPLGFGTFVKQAQGLGRVFAVRSLGHYLVGVTNGRYGEDGEFQEKPKQLFVVDLENGASNTYEVGLENPHCLAVAEDESIYVGEIGPNRLTKINI